MTEEIPMPRRSRPACPICGRLPVQEYKPFCSRRCADVDLARWLGGVYRVTESDPEAEIEEGEEEPRR